MTQLWTLDDGDLKMVISDWRRRHLETMQGFVVTLGVYGEASGEKKDRGREKTHQQTKKEASSVDAMN